jgi:hypothetical protein
MDSADVVDEHVHPAEAGYRLIDKGLAPGCGGEVAQDDGDVTLVGEGDEVGGVFPRSRRHAGSLPDHALRYREPDSFAGPRDDDGLAG